MTVPRMTRGRLIALTIVGLIVLGLAALGGSEFWSIVANLVGA